MTCSRPCTLTRTSITSKNPIRRIQRKVVQAVKVKTIPVQFTTKRTESDVSGFHRMANTCLVAIGPAMFVFMIFSLWTNCVKLKLTMLKFCAWNTARLLVWEKWDRHLDKEGNNFLRQNPGKKLWNFVYNQDRKCSRLFILTRFCTFLLNVNIFFSKFTFFLNSHFFYQKIHFFKIHIFH